MLGVSAGVSVLGVCARCQCWGVSAGVSVLGY